MNLGGSRTAQLRKMIRVLGEEMGVEPAIYQLPVQAGDVTRTYANVTRARRLLGYEQNTEFRDGIREFLAWLEGDSSFQT